MSSGAESRPATLFELPVEDGMSPDKESNVVGGRPRLPRLRCPERNQVQFRACSWNDLLPADHPGPHRVGFGPELRLVAPG